MIEAHLALRTVLRTSEHTLKKPRNAAKPLKKPRNAAKRTMPIAAALFERNAVPSKPSRSMKTLARPGAAVQLNLDKHGERDNKTLFQQPKLARFLHLVP